MSELLKPRVAVIKAPGTNCDEETAYAFDISGGQSEIVLVHDLKTGAKKLSDYQILAAPGGFSYGDDLGSGKVAAIELETYLGDELARFMETSLMIAVCNGFQEMTRMGLIPDGTIGKQTATLDRNESGKFIHRRVKLKFEEENSCVFLNDLTDYGPVEFQIASGEGKYTASKEDLDRLERGKQVVFRYADMSGNPTQEYPFNPNGSPNAIAGLTDPSGRSLTLMPHPERSTDRYHYPNEERLSADFIPEGLVIFKQMINYAKQGV